MIGNLIYLAKVSVFTLLLIFFFKMEVNGKTFEQRAEVMLTNSEIGIFYTNGAKGFGKYLKDKWDILMNNKTVKKAKTEVKGRIDFEVQRSEEFLREQQDKAIQKAKNKSVEDVLEDTL